MHAFAEAWPVFEIVQQAVAQLGFVAASLSLLNSLIYGLTDMATISVRPCPFKQSTQTNGSERAQLSGAVHKLHCAWTVNAFTSPV